MICDFLSAVAWRAQKGNPMNCLKETPEFERPYEKAVRSGIASLTDSELLAVVLRNGTTKMDVLSLSRRLLNLNDTKEGLCGLMHHSYSDYLSCEGIGKVKAVQLLALGELSRRIWRLEKKRFPAVFSDSSACADYYMQEMRHLEQEELHIAFLDTKLRLMREETITKGTVNASLISVREIMISALKNRAVFMILIHNHPSGDPSPSTEDSVVTRRVVKAGEIIGITLIDHIIIGDNSYYSFKEWGTL